MADLISWEPGMSVGVSVLDEDHKRIMNMINRFYNALCDGEGKDTLDEIFHDLMVYINLHFESEEAMLKQTHYPGADDQKAHHKAMAARVVAEKKKYEQNENSKAPIEMLNFLKDWWVDHIMNLDRKYAAHLKAHGLK